MYGCRQESLYLLFISIYEIDWQSNNVQPPCSEIDGFYGETSTLYFTEHVYERCGLLETHVQWKYVNLL